MNRVKYNWKSYLSSLQVIQYGVVEIWTDDLYMIYTCSKHFYKIFKKFQTKCFRISGTLWYQYRCCHNNHNEGVDRWISWFNNAIDINLQIWCIFVMEIPIITLHVNLRMEAIKWNSYSFIAFKQIYS